MTAYSGGAEYGKGRSGHGTVTVTVGVRRDELVASLKDGLDQLLVPGGTTVGGIGWPGLPAKIMTIALPPGAHGVAAELVEQQWEALPGVFRLAPVQPPRRVALGPIGPDDGPRPDPANPEAAPLSGLSAEALAQQIITSPVAVTAQGHLAGTALAYIRVPVARYSPGPGRVDILTGGTLTVTYLCEAVDSPAASPAPVSPLAAWHDAQLLKGLDIVGLPDRLATVSPTVSPTVGPAVCPATAAELAVGGPWPPRWWPSEGEFPYVIISDDVRRHDDGSAGEAVPNMTDAFRRLAHWKTATGLRARLVTVSDILANRYGNHNTADTRDTQEAIRAFCKTVHETWSTRWLLIGGDVDIVPIRHVLGNILFHIGDDQTGNPGNEQRYYVAGDSRMRYRPDKAVTQSMTLVRTDDGIALRYQPGANVSAPGWYFVADDWTTPSATPTSNVLVVAPPSWLTGTFTRVRYENSIPTDMYYASVVNPTLYGRSGQHDWDLDGNQVYGFDAGNGTNPDGLDLHADISVGRVPARVAGDANAWIDKILSYETFVDARHGTELDGSFPHRLLAIGAVLGDNWSDSSEQRIRWGDMDGACADRDTTIATLRVVGATIDRVRRFYGDGYFAQNRSDVTELTDAQIPALRQAINDGPAFVTVSGHGWWDGCARLASTNPTNYPNFANVRDMTNGMRAGVWFVDSCLTNDIDVDFVPLGINEPPNGPCLGKHLMVRDGGGAVAYVGYPREGLVGCSLEQSFWSPMSCPKSARLGLMADHARSGGLGRRMVDTYEILLLLLLGDPEMHIRSRTPDAVSISMPAVVYGGDDLTVEVFLADVPVDDWNLTVAVTQETADADHPAVFRLIGRDQNRFTFDTSQALAGTLSVCVTAPNCIPALGSADKVTEPVSDAARHLGGVVASLINAGTSIVAGTSAGVVAGMSSRDLSLAWQYTMPGEILGLDAAPDGTVLAGASAASGVNLVLLDAQGIPQHAWSTGRSVYAVARDPGRGLVYAGLCDGGMVAFHTTDGSQAWTGGSSNCIGLAVAPDGRVLATDAGDGKSRLDCRQPDGTVAWTYHFDGNKYSVMALAVTSEGTCWVATRDAHLYRVTADGTGASVPLSLDPDAPAISLLADGSDLLVGCGGGLTLRLASDGSEMWRTHTGERVESLAVHGPYTYAGCWSRVQALDDQGQHQWARETNSTVISQAITPKAHGPAHLFAGTRDGWVYSVEIADNLAWAASRVDAGQGLVRV